MTMRERIRGLGPTLTIAGAVVLALLIGSTGYGPHRDELYFLAAGDNLALGYPDQGPLTPAIAALADAVAPGSLLALRLLPALMIGAIVILTALIARELGGTRRAELIAAASVAVGSVFLITGHLLSTTTFDLLAWTLVTWLAVRAIRTGQDSLWIWAGLALGVGLLNKPLPVFLAFALLAGVLIAGPRGMLRNRWVWAGAALAVVIWSPWLIWQANEGWPQLDVAAELSDGGSTSSESRWAFLPFQLLLISPLLAPIWIAGLIRLVRDPAVRSYRFLAWAWVVLAVVFVVSGGKPYYLAGMFPVLLAVGAAPVDRWVERGRTWLRSAALAGAFVLSALVSVTLALPVLPTDRLDPVLAANEDVGETVGWPEFTEQVAGVYASAGPPESTAILTINYGEAGAIDRYGRALGLPEAHSGHNAYWDWGPPPEDTTNVVAIGFPESGLDGLGGCTIEARIQSEADIDNEEDGAPVWVCDGPVEPWSAIWPSFKRLG